MDPQPTPRRYWRCILAAAGLVLMAAACSPAAPPSPTAAPVQPAPTTALAKQETKPAATTAPAKAAPTPAASPVAKAAFDEQAVADFYRGKTVRIIVGTTAGGGFDVTSRLIARYIGRYIPGNPTVIVENRPGAGQALAANAVYATEPKDGTVVGNFDSSVALRQALGEPGVSFDSAKFHWLGSTTRDATACLVRGDTGVKTVQDAMGDKEIVLGTLSPGNNTHDVPAVLNATLGTRFKLVPGYEGVSKMRLATESGEVDGFCITYKGMLVNDLQWLEGDDPFARVVVVMGDRVPGEPVFKSAAAAETLAKTDEARQLLQVIDVPQLINKPYAVAPEVPADRVAALRSALAKTYADQEFLAEAKQGRIDIEPASGEETARVVQRVLATPPAVLAKLKEIIRQ